MGASVSSLLKDLSEVSQPNEIKDLCLKIQKEMFIDETDDTDSVPRTFKVKDGFNKGDLATPEVAQKLADCLLKKAIPTDILSTIILCEVIRVAVGYSIDAATAYGSSADVRYALGQAMAHYVVVASSSSSDIKHKEALTLAVTKTVQCILQDASRGAKKEVAENFSNWLPQTLESNKEHHSIVMSCHQVLAAAMLRDLNHEIANILCDSVIVGAVRDSLDAYSDAKDLEKTVVPFISSLLASDSDRIKYVFLQQDSSFLNAAAAVLLKHPKLRQKVLFVNNIINRLQEGRCNILFQAIKNAKTNEQVRDALSDLEIKTRTQESARAYFARHHTTCVKPLIEILAEDDEDEAKIKNDENCSLLLGTIKNILTGELSNDDDKKHLELVKSTLVSTQSQLTGSALSRALRPNLATDAKTFECASTIISDLSNSLKHVSRLSEGWRLDRVQKAFFTSENVKNLIERGLSPELTNQSPSSINQVAHALRAGIHISRSNMKEILIATKGENNDDDGDELLLIRVFSTNSLHCLNKFPTKSSVPVSLIHLILDLLKSSDAAVEITSSIKSVFGTAEAASIFISMIKANIQHGTRECMSLILSLISTLISDGQEEDNNSSSDNLLIKKHFIANKAEFINDCLCEIMTTYHEHVDFDEFITMPQSILLELLRGADDEDSRAEVVQVLATEKFVVDVFAKSLQIYQIRNVEHAKTVSEIVRYCLIVDAGHKQLFVSASDGEFVKKFKDFFGNIDDAQVNEVFEETMKLLEQ